MEFADKLNYLFELTHAEGKELADAMNVTPPQISKMRRGNRGLPRDKTAARVLARFFAQRCGSDFQRNELAKTLRIAQIRTIEKESILIDVLLDWLANEQDPDDYAARKAGAFLQQFEGRPEQPEEEGPAAGDPRSVLTTGDSNLFVYYGNEGRRWAVQTFLRYLAQQKLAYTVNILTDENQDWVTETPEFSTQLQASMLRLTEQGCVFRRIAAPILDMDQAFESLNRWLPLYMTGRAASFYYKRMRDSLNRITLFVVPEVAVMFSFSVGPVPQNNAATFFTIDPRTVNALATEFEHYLALCEPIMSIYSTDDSLTRLLDCMLDYESCRSDCIQRSNSLSVITLPWNVAMSLNPHGSPQHKNEFLSSFAQRYKQFRQNIQKYSFTDIIRLAELKDIMAGTVPISAACIFSGERQYYTPAGYLQHLQSILYLLEHQEHYHVVLRDPADTDPNIVYVKEGIRAILVRETYPFSVFEVAEHHLVDAFVEYLQRLAADNQMGNQAEISHKRSVVATIRALIGQIEQQLRTPHA